MPFGSLIVYLQQPAWSRSREFDITTRSVNGLTQRTTGDLEDEDDESVECPDGSNHRKRKGGSISTFMM